MSTESESLAAVASETRQALDRLRAATRRSLDLPSKPDIAPVDLEALAKLAGLPLDVILAMPDEPRKQPVADDPRRFALLGSRMPAMFADVILGELDDSLPLVAVQAWLLTSQWAIVLGGCKGTGKSIAAAWGLVEHARMRRAALKAAGAPEYATDESLRGGLFCTTEELASPDGGNEMAARAREATYLHLDDMGDEAIGDVSLSRIRGALTYRHGHGRKTAITTNLNRYAEPGGAPQWTERYGERLDDRLVDGFIAFDGDSLRGAK